SGSIKTVEIVLETSNGKHGAVIQDENRSETQKEATDSTSTKSLRRCHSLRPRHQVRFAAGPACCTTGFASSKAFLLALVRGEAKSCDNPFSHCAAAMQTRHD